MRIVLVIFHLIFSIGICYCQQKDCKLNIRSIEIDPNNRSNYIVLYRNDPGKSTELRQSKIKRGKASFNFKVDEPFWGYISLKVNDSIIIYSSNFLLTNDDIKIEITSLKSLPIISGGENDFIIKHRLLLFALPNIITSYPGFNLNEIRSKYDYSPSDIRLKLYWQEYENNIIEQIESKRNYYFLLEKLLNIKNQISLKTVEKCYNLFSDTLKNTKSGRLLKQYIEQSRKVLLEQKISLFEVWDSEIKKVSSSNLINRYNYTLIDFWASWCIPCREKMQELKKQYDKIDTSLLQIISISIDDKRDDWLEAYNNIKFPWKSYYDTAGQRGNIVKIFSLDYVPQNIIVDSLGKIVAMNLWDEDLYGFLKKKGLITR